MIIKSKSIKDRNAIARTVRYVFQEEKDYSILYSKFLPSNANVVTIIESFEKNEAQRIRRRKDSVILFHDFISFHKDDSHKLQDDQWLKTISREYSSMRGMSICLCILHRERDHIHVHILASGCGIDGKSARISKSEFEKKKKQLEKMQQLDLRLVHSRVNHEKKSIHQPLS